MAGGRRQHGKRTDWCWRDLAAMFADGSRKAVGHEEVIMRGVEERKLADGLNRFREQFLGLHIDILRSGFRCLAKKIKTARENGRWHKRHYNLFGVLGRQRLEETHSNIVAWLLDPDEAHGLGDRFLREFLSAIGIREPLPPTGLVAVVREEQQGGDRPDIVVRGEGWLLVVENKIGASEGDQTARYAARYKRQARRSYFALLTPDGRPSTYSPDFRSISYRQLRLILNGLCEDIRSEEVRFLIAHLSAHIQKDLENAYDRPEL
jgi:hypothetical protein